MFWNIYQDNKASSSSNQSYDWVVYFIWRTNRNVSRCIVINLFLISSYPMSRFPIVRSKNQSVYYSSWFILYFSIIRVVTIIHYWSNSLDDWRVFNEYSLIYVYRTIDIKEGTTINIQISYDFIQSCLNLKDYILTSLIPKYAGLLDWKNDSSQSMSTSVVVQTNQERKKKEVVINVCLQLIHISGSRQDWIRWRYSINIHNNSPLHWNWGTILSLFWAHLIKYVMILIIPWLVDVDRHTNNALIEIWNHGKVQEGIYHWRL